MSNLIIFVDGLPHYYLKRAKFLNSFPYQKKISPGIGYSVNIKPEMFAGLKPDDIGYFCEWGVGNSSPPKWQEKLAALHFSYRWPVFDRVLHKILNKFGFDLANIPFGYVQYFDKGERKSVYKSDFPFPNLFSEMDMVTILADGMDRKNGSRDAQAYHLAQEKIAEAKDIYISFLAMDEGGHIYGVGSPGYDRTLAQIDGWIENLVTQFEEANPGGNVIIFSDHGMVNVDHGVKVNFEQHLGPSNPQTYLYFLDSATMRIWIYRDELKPKIEKYLQDLGCGTILSQEQRAKWGATEKYCGDMIFVLNEGYVFAPSFFGLKKAAAMHGYLPDLENQQAIFLAKGNDVKVIDFDRVSNTQHLYAYLLNLGKE